MSLVHQYLISVVAIPAQRQLEALMEAVLPMVAERRRLIELTRKCVHARMQCVQTVYVLTWSLWQKKWKPATYNMYLIDLVADSFYTAQKLCWYLHASITEASEEERDEDAVAPLLQASP